MQEARDAVHAELLAVCDEGFSRVNPQPDCAPYLGLHI